MKFPYEIISVKTEEKVRFQHIFKESSKFAFQEKFSIATSIVNRKKFLQILSDQHSFHICFSHISDYSSQYDAY